MANRFVASHYLFGVFVHVVVKSRLAKGFFSNRWLPTAQGLVTYWDVQHNRNAAFLV